MTDQRQANEDLRVIAATIWAAMLTKEGQWYSYEDVWSEARNLLCWKREHIQGE